MGTHTSMEMTLQTLRERGPRVNIRIPGLREYLIHFNGPKTYQDHDSRHARGATNRFNYGIESTPPKTFSKRLREFLWPIISLTPRRPRKAFVISADHPALKSD